MVTLKATEYCMMNYKDAKNLWLPQSAYAKHWNLNFKIKILLACLGSFRWPWQSPKTLNIAGLKVEVDCTSCSIKKRLLNPVFFRGAATFSLTMALPHERGVMLSERSVDLSISIDNHGACYKLHWCFLCTSFQYWVLSVYSFHFIHNKFVCGWNEYIDAHKHFKT